MMRRPVQGSVYHGRGAVWPLKFNPEMEILAQQGLPGGREIVLGGKNSVLPGRNTDFPGRNTVFQERDAFWRAKPVTEWKVKKVQKKSASRRKLNRKAKRNRAFEYLRHPDLECQKRLKASRFDSKIFRAPSAPHNTTSYLIRAKASGGQAPLVFPSPASPAIIPTPILSPSPCYREGLADEVHEEWGVNGYGSMKGLIRLRATKIETQNDDSENDSDLITPTQSVQQLEKKLDQDVSRFEMIYFPVSPSSNSPNSLETLCGARDSHITHLVEENLILNDRLYLMKRELDDLRRRMQVLEGGVVSDEEAKVLSEISVGDT